MTDRSIDNDDDVRILINQESEEDRDCIYSKWHANEVSLRGRSSVYVSIHYTLYIFGLAYSNKLDYMPNDVSAGAHQVVCTTVLTQQNAIVCEVVLFSSQSITLQLQQTTT